MDKCEADIHSIKPVLRITLRNDFHGTTCVVRCRDGDVLSRRVTRRARRILCGVAECQCSGACGARGPQWTRVAGEDVMLWIFPAWGPNDCQAVQIRLEPH